MKTPVPSLQVNDILDMVLDEVAQCDVPVVLDTQHAAYRASHALSGLEILGRQYCSLKHKHYVLARHILRFLKHSACIGDSAAFRQFRNAVRLTYPDLLVRIHFRFCVGLLWTFASKKWCPGLLSRRHIVACNW